MAQHTFGLCITWQSVRVGQVSGLFPWQPRHCCIPRITIWMWTEKLTLRLELVSVS